jgi:G-patch domain
MSATSSKVSFTVRRPSPISRETSSGPDSDSQPFKIPAIPRHLNGNSSNPGSPLARSAAPSPKRSFIDRDSSDEDEEVEDELVTGFDRFGVRRCVISSPTRRSGSQLTAVIEFSLHEKQKPQGPLVIPALKNRDWRELAKRRKTNEMFVPASARAAATGADGSVGGLGTKDTINSGPQAVGLHIKSNVVTEVQVEVDMAEADTRTPKVEETEDQKAIRALLASATSDGDQDGPQIESIPVHTVTEDDAYRQDVVELPDSATLDDYERVPVSQFGAALLRGMGWKEGTAASKTKKGMIEPWMPQARPALLGIGAKEKEVFDDGSKQKKYGGKPDKKYIPLVKKERSGDERSGSRPSSSRHSESRSRRPSRSPSPDRSSRGYRNGTEDSRDHRRKDSYRDERGRDKDSSGHRAREREGRRDRSRDRHDSYRRDRRDD